MTRKAYVNGRYVTHQEAAVHINDRGYQFADGVYEVMAVRRGRIIDLQRHMERLARSLEGLHMDWPMSDRAMTIVMGEVIRHNLLESGYLYLQVTRGVAPRNHAFPKECTPSLVVTAWRKYRVPAKIGTEPGVDVITLPDSRWKRCDIKSISLLPNVMAKQAAIEAGAFEAWLVDDNGYITEGSSSNAWIVTADGELLTRDCSPAILNGITRMVILELAHANSIAFSERPFSVDEAKGAKEAFLTSTTSMVTAVGSIDGVKIGNGNGGELCTKMAALYDRHISNG